MARTAELEAKVAELTARLSQNSTNSSKPPTSDPPWALRQAKPPSVALLRRRLFDPSTMLDS